MKILCFGCSLILGFVGFCRAQTPTPTATPDLFWPTPAPRWTAPVPPDPSGREVQYGMNLAGTEDREGPRVETLLDLSLRRLLAVDSIEARGLLRFQKPFAGREGGESVEIRQATLLVVRPEVTFGLGRLAVGPMLGPTAFFGPYPTMGQRRLDGAYAFVPVNFLFGPGTGKPDATPAALTLFYFPTLFSPGFADLSRNQSVVLGQARLRFFGSRADTLLFLNFGGAHAEVFSFSTVNGNNHFSAAVEVVFEDDFSFYADGGMQSVSFPESTSVLALGAKARRIRTWGSLSFDEAVVEVQVPLGQDRENPFTGGNAFFPLLAEVPGTAWYAKAAFRFQSLLVEIHATTSRGDYTFGRLDPRAVSVPLSAPPGPPNEIDGLQVPLAARGYDRPAFLGRVGVEF